MVSCKVYRYDHRGTLNSDYSVSSRPACVWNGGGGTVLEITPNIYLLHVSAPVEAIIKHYKQITLYNAPQNVEGRLYGYPQLKVRLLV
jgi:hypothetical protein